MRKMLLMAACVSFSLLSFGGLPGAARSAAADEAANPAAAGMVAPARAFVRLWTTPGVFEKSLFGRVNGSTLYIGGAPRGLEALDVKTGLPKWLHPGTLPPDFPPIQHNNILYLVEGGRLVTLNPDTGEELSRVRPRFSFFTPAYPMDTYCIFASGDQYVYSISVQSGSKVWRDAVDGYPTASIWNGSDTIYFTTSQGILYAVAMPTMEISWHHQFPRQSCSAPTLAGNFIYVGSSDYYLYALNAALGDVEWKLSLSAPVLGRPVVVGSRLYVATAEHLIHAVDLSTHKDLWTIPGNRLLTTTPDHLIFLRHDTVGNVIGMADAANGKVISEMTAEGYVHFAAPAEGGIFYAIGKTGDVLAIGDRAAIEAREAAQEAARAEPATATAAAPTTAPAAAPTSAASTAPTAPANEPKP